jgi:hypothetical protein
MFSYKGYVFKYNNEYVKMYSDTELPIHYTLTECGKFYRLIKYIVGNNQLLGYRSDRVKPLTATKIGEIFGCGKRQAKKLIEKMKKDKIIKEVDINGTRWYAVNPLYALKGKYLSLTTFIIFQDELIPILPFSVTNRFMGEARDTTDKIEIKE